MFADSHCHLNHEALASDLAGCLQRAREAGVTEAIVVGYDLASSWEALRLTLREPGLFATAGIHPHEAIHFSEAALAEIAELAMQSKVVAIGEIGLDFYYDHSPREAQYAAFEAQMNLAGRVGLPVVIHCREAYPETLAVLSNYPLVRGVMHCWGGSTEEAGRALEMGYALGFGGVITFKNAETVRECLRFVPADRILLETDAPYLAPVPYRGKRNEPAYLAEVARAAALVRDESTEEFGARAAANTRRLFSRMRGESEEPRHVVASEAAATPITGCPRRSSG